MNAKVQNLVKRMSNGMNMAERKIDIWKIKLEKSAKCRIKL